MASDRDGAEPDRLRDAPPRQRGMRLAAVLISLVLSLALLELAVRLFLPAEPPAAVSQVGDGSELIEHDDRIGWVLAPRTSVRQQSADFDVTIATNAAGQREQIDYTAAPRPGMRRVVALGDSFTFGYGVEQDQSYPELLERALPDLEVINLAVPGYGIDQMLLTWRERGAEWRPGVVVLGLFEGTVFRDARSFQLVYPKPRYVIENGELVLTNVPVPALGSATPFELPLASLELLVTRGRDLYEHLGYGEAWRVTDRILVALRDAASDHGARILAVLIPKDRAVLDSGWRRAIHLRALERMAAMLQRAGIEHVDTTPALADWARAQRDEPLYFPSDGHWTPAAHRVAARAIERPLAAALAASSEATAP